jgi:hypothetical protein
MIHSMRRGLKKVVKRGTIFQAVAESCQCFLWKHAPRFFEWKLDKSAVGIDLTMKCNLSCGNCNRAVGLAPSDETISVEQVGRFVRESLDGNWNWRRILLAGGEPTLHPRLADLLEALALYKKRHPDCYIGIVTNGWGERVRSVLSSLPAWAGVVNSEKVSGTQRFHTFNVAPVDVEALRNDDFSRGCFTIEYCGMALTRYGYYCCAPASAVDRVFGFDLGLKSISAVTDAALKDQLQRLCRYCGHYKYNYREPWSTAQQISPSWQDAVKRYRKETPRLTLY